MENVSDIMTNFTEGLTDADFIYKADESKFKSAAGAAATGKEITFSVLCSRRFYACNIYIVFSGEKESKIKMVWKSFEKGFDVLKATFMAQKAGLYHYHFEIDIFGMHYYAGRGAALRSEIGSSEEFTLLVYNNFNTPDWIKGGVMYQIFVDRFFRGKETPLKPYAEMHKSLDEYPFYGEDKIKRHNYDFFGGNLDGIRQKLPYLKALGVNCILLSPIFEAYSNHKYDVGDYEKTDTMFGTDEDFVQLCKTAEDFGIRIIIDGVFNHTGSDSRYFDKYGTYGGKGAYNDKNSPYYEWYTFTSYPDKYESWWGIESLPQIKKDSASYQNYIVGKGGIIETWLDRGAAGVRLDVVDELSNSFINKINACCKRKSEDVFIIGEVWEDAAEKWAYGELKEYFWGGGLDSVINYPLRKGIIEYMLTGDCILLAETLLNIWDKYPRPVCHCLMNVLGTHDTARILTLLGEIQKPLNRLEKYKLTKVNYEKAVKKLQAASLIQFTVYGVPCIYYGDERGSEGGDDPFNRMAVIWDKYDENIFNWYQQLGEIRKNDVFKTGEFKELHREDGVYIFRRYNGKSSAITAVNMSHNNFVFKADGYKVLLTADQSDIIDKSGIVNLKSGNFALLFKIP
jgi:glycosidase